MIIFCHYFNSDTSMFTDLLTPLATIFSVFVAALIGVFTWDYQAKKKKVIDLRIETFKDILNLCFVMKNFSKNLKDEILGKEFENLLEKINIELWACANELEIAAYRKFGDFVDKVEKQK